jgi:DNA-binding Lrp family transcriptional regulator
MIRLARAIARASGRGLLLTQDNAGDGWVPIEAAVASGRAYAVELRRDVLALDGDQPGAGAAAAAVARALRARGLEPLVVPSGQPGRWHLFCRVGSVELRRRVAEEARRRGLDVRRCIRPPWSPHRLALPVAPPAPGELDAAVAALGPLRAHGCLSPATWRRLRHGDPAAPSRSECDWSVALGFANAGRDVDDLFRALMDDRNAAGVKVRELAARRGLGEAHRYVGLRHRRATSYVAVHPAIATPTDARGEILAIRDAIASLPWPGRTGDTDRAVLEAEIDLRLELGRLQAWVSERDLAERVGMSRPTVAAARRRLQDQGLLKRIPTDRRCTQAQTWRLCHPPRALFGHADLQFPSGGRQGMAKNCAWDGWRHGRVGGLGRGCWRVWQLLDAEEPVSAGELAARLGVHPATVRRRLARLAGVGLAERLEHDGTWRPVERDLAAVVRELDVDEETGQPRVEAAAARQRARHDADRDAWEQEVARRRAWHLADEAERYLAELDDEEREAAAAAVAAAHPPAGAQDPMASQPRPRQLQVLELDAPPVQATAAGRVPRGARAGSTGDAGGPARPASDRRLHEGRLEPGWTGRTGPPEWLAVADADVAAAVQRLVAAFGPVRFLPG